MRDLVIMCIIAVDWNPDEKLSLILAANRDEFYERPSQVAKYWHDKPEIYGGRDLLSGGSWLCCSTSGRCAAITNFFDQDNDWEKKFPKSRGEITTNFVISRLAADDFVQQLEQDKCQYGGFNALLFDGKSLIYCTNRDKKKFSKTLSTGIYGLSNHLLDTSWPKVEKLKVAIAQARHWREDQQRLAAELMDALEDTERVNDRSLLPTILGEEEEFHRSAIFVKAGSFGTRTSTILTFTANDGFLFVEKNHQTPSSTSISSSHAFIAQRI